MTLGELLGLGMLGGAPLAVVRQVAGLVGSRARGQATTETVAARAGFATLAVCCLCLVLLAIGVGR